MKIGGVRLNNNILMAPMAGVSDMPFRVLCHEQGCGLVYTEMVSAKAILFNNPKTDILLQTHPNEGPVGVQLFGNDPRILSEMAKKIDCDGVTLFDVNMGCPVPKIFNNGEGSALMKSPELVGRIVEALTLAVNKPITVKIRKGIDDEHVNAVEIALIAEASGAKAITVHGRTKEQYYGGKADWDIIKKVKEAVKIPVIGNGDVFTAIDAKDLLEVTGCDGVMVARGAQGNPWIFKEINHFFSTGELLNRPSEEEIFKTIIRHAQMLEEAKGEYTAMREMRKHISWYTKGMKNSNKMRSEMNQIETMDMLMVQLEKLTRTIN